MLTTKERAQLRAISNNFDNLVQIGKEGVTNNVIKLINDNLTAHELIKIKVQQNQDAPVKEICDEIIAKTNAEPVSVCGKKIVIYRRTDKKGFKHYL